MSTRVKGIKYGTMSQYLAMSSHDADTLYFITDRGLLYRGRSIVVPVNVVEAALSTTPPNGVAASNHAPFGATFTITTYGSDPANPEVLTFDVYNRTAVDAIRNLLQQAIDDHRRISEGVYADGKAYTEMDGDAYVHHYGHVRLTDNVNMTSAENTNLDAASGGAAVTPYGVRNAITGALSTALGNLSGAMLFKGTLGDAPAYSDSATYAVGDHCTKAAGQQNRLYKCTTAIGEPEAWNVNHWTQVPRTVASLPTNGYKTGWTYKVVAPGTYAGKPCEAGDFLVAINDGPATGNTVVNDDWTVTQANLDGAVTADADLDLDTLALGNGARTVKKLANGSAGQYLRIGADGKPQWANHAITFGQCNTERGHEVKQVGLVTGIGELVTGTIIAVTFKYEVDGGASLKIGDSGTSYAIIHKKPSQGGYTPSTIEADTIHAGDTATFMYDEGTYFIGNDRFIGVWHLLAVDHLLADVALSGSYTDLSNNPTKLSQFTNDIIRRGTCATGTATAAKVVTAPNFVLTTGGVVSVFFAKSVNAGATLNVNNTGAKAIKHQDQALVTGVILDHDTATFVYDGTSYHLIAIDRPTDDTPTANSTNLVTSGGVYSAINSAVASGLGGRNFFGTCPTASNVAAKQAYGNRCALNVGAVVTVRFANAVETANATLSLTGNNGTTWTTPARIFYDGAALAAGVILDGDTVTFMYDGSVFNLIAFAYEGLKWESLPAVTQQEEQS